MIDPDHPQLSIRRQCELISISRASFYRQPAGETPENLELMRVIDEAFRERPGMAPGRWRGICGVRAGLSAASGSGG
jgi:epoxyqueuosine reductase QueG